MEAELIVEVAVDDVPHLGQSRERLFQDERVLHGRRRVERRVERDGRLSGRAPRRGEGGDVDSVLEQGVAEEEQPGVSGGVVETGEELTSRGQPGRHLDGEIEHDEHRERGDDGREQAPSGHGQKSM
ncbi:hypothetical protein ACN28S_45925 [Cystobacter fuscus]